MNNVAFIIADIIIRCSSFSLRFAICEQSNTFDAYNFSKSVWQFSQFRLRQTNGNSNEINSINSMETWDKLCSIWKMYQKWNLAFGAFKCRKMIRWVKMNRNNRLQTSTVAVCITLLSVATYYISRSIMTKFTHFQHHLSPNYAFNRKYGILVAIACHCFFVSVKLHQRKTIMQQH